MAKKKIDMVPEEYKYTIEIYETGRGKSPFSDWLKKFKDLNAKTAIRMRLDRARLGNLGSARFLAKGVSELKVDIGAGIRIYYAMVAKDTILLLCAGTKRTQKQDIASACSYLKDYKEVLGEKK